MTTKAKAKAKAPAARKPVRFTTALVLGHKGVTPVIVPFDPRAMWGVEPVALDARREGWLVEGTMNDAAFFGWIGLRWGRHFIIVDPALRAAAGVAVGDDVEVAVSPSTAPEALAVAKAQAPLTTAPGRKRGGAAKRAPRAAPRVKSARR